jgi:hypothetical protein
MAITRAQQAKQMLQDGGMLVQPSKTGKRPGYRGPGGYQGGRSSSAREAGASASRSRSTSSPTSSVGGDDRREQVSVARTQGKDAPRTSQIRRDIISGPDRSRGSTRLSNLMKLDRFKTFKPEVKTPPLGVLRFLKGPLQGLSNFTTTKNRAFFEDVIRAGKIPGLNFATVSDMTDEELEKEYQDYMSARLSGETDAYGNPNPGFGKDDGPDPIIPLITTTDDTEDNTEDDPTNIFAKAGITPRIAGSIFAAEGGRIGAAEGGIMELARQEMFLGGIAKGIKKAVKGVSRTIKKVAKSPIGKIALAAAAGGYGFGLGPFKGMAGSGFLKGSAVKNFLFKDGVPGLSNLSGKGIASIIGGASLLPLLMGPKEEDEFDIESYYAANRLNPNAALNPRIAGSQFAFADGGRIGYSDGMEAGAISEKEMKKLAKSPLYKGFKKMYGIDPSMAKENKAYDEKFDMFEKLFKKGFAEGGDVEPVAKKTMPLLDMDGQEMDLRAEGGFVPIGRMEKADDVPARLSKNEFVFTADAVRNAGDGNVDKGAEVMYNMMKNLESGGDVSEESQGLSGAREMFQTSKRLEEVL